jgi:hypothetical protein
MRLFSALIISAFLRALSQVSLLATAIESTAVKSDGGIESNILRWRGETVQDLHAEYPNIFTHGNRNAASHLWASFILDRAYQMNEAKLLLMFSSFCAVSGSPVRPSDYARYHLMLPSVASRALVSGFMYYCCWPCVCDTQDFIRVDTLTVTTLDGPVQHNVAVIGNPCDHPEKMALPFVQPFGYRQTTVEREAPMVRCTADGALKGATLSDHGYVIISLFFPARTSADGSDAAMVAAEAASGQLDFAGRNAQPGRMSEANGVLFQDEFEYSGMCQERAASGYNSGMGEIFRRVASISPVGVAAGAALALADGG